MESPRSPDAESAELANCAEEIARLVRPLEKNQQRWVDLQKNLESNDVADEVRQLGAAVVQAGLVVAANLLTALKGTGGDEPFDPDPGVLLQYHQSLPSERKRLAVWKQHAGPKPVSPIRRILEMYEEQLLEVSSLKTVAECLQRHELRKASPEVAASAPSSAPAGPGADPEHLVLLVHGIRTEAHWQERVADVIVRTGLATAQPFRYGYFDLFRFLTPGDFTRHTPVSRLHREIREISRVYPDAKLTVIAHSFGTIAICRLLEDFPDLVLHRLILCGSVVPHYYRWDRIREQVQNRVLNECGARDIWPRLAAVCTWGYGATGAVGFGTLGVRDRFHLCRHSDFFTEKFVTMYWLPFILFGEIPVSETDLTRAPAPLLHRLVSNVPIRWILVCVVLSLMLTVAGFAYVGLRAWLHLPWSFLGRSGI